MEMNLQKHAYLIMAHNNFDQLTVLLKQIDDERNDIYIHFDKKCTPPPSEKFTSVVKKSNIYILSERIEVNWGGDSQIRCELLLLKTASSNKQYNYYHLMSGICLAIKSQDYIHNFFQEHNGTEFISVQPDEKFLNKVKYRYKYYFHILKIMKNPRQKWKKGILAILMILQKMVGIDRSKKTDVVFKAGASWFSITDKCARYVLSKEDWIFEVFHDSFCGDELFLQTVVYNSELKEKIYINPNGDSCMRLIDWTRGRPYTFRISDFEQLSNSPMLFARKFNQNVDNDIIEKIIELTKN